MSFADPIQFARELAEAPIEQVIRSWKDDHPRGKVVGWFPVYSPVEIAHAAGMFPLAVAGGGNQIEVSHADSRFQSFVCSIVKTTLELGLTGQLNQLDGMIFHSICDPAKNLASVFRRNFPEVLVDFIHYPQNFSSTLTEDYLVSEYSRIRERFAKLSGNEITDESLRSSIAIYNAVRERIRTLDRLRLDRPDQIPVSERVAVLRAGARMMPEAFVALLDDTLRVISERRETLKDRIPVILEGSFCEQPPLDLIDAIEQAGCSILDDDFELGSRWFTSNIPLDDDPLRALAKSYINGSVHSAVKHDLRYRKADPLVEKLNRTGAQAVVVLTPKFCEPAMFDYALYRRELENRHIPHVVLEFEERTWTFDRIRGELETFVESMMFD